MADITGGPGGETLNGTGDDDRIFGLGGNDTLNGFGGNDLLDGGEGADAMAGGGQNDTYKVDDVGDSVAELAGEGDDIVAARVSYALAMGASIETLTTDNDAGTAAINLTGNDLGNSIYGNAGNNVLSGGGGIDLLVGNAGNDILIGGAGADVLRGGIGNDTYRIDDSLDIIVEPAGEGDDTVSATASYQLADGLSIETMTTTSQAGTASIDLIGNEVAQSIFGNAGNNLLNGGGGDDQLIGYEGNDILVGAAGRDVMRGNTGNDVYRVEDTLDIIFEFAGEGDDTISASASYQLADGLSIETMTVVSQATTDPISLVGNEGAQSIFGNAGNNLLNGGGGDDQLVGYEGNDILEGAAGFDVMRGNSGNDVYRVEDTLDQIFEAAGEGDDIIQASTSYALGAGLSIETMTVRIQGTTNALNLTGNEIGQSISGNDGANVLNGSGGIDLLRGYAGADLFEFSAALGANNIDIVADFSVADDTIRLGGSAGEPFEALASGALAASAFVIGTAAQDANDYLIYNSATGALLYDADGNGALAAVQFATLGTGLAMTAADFIVSGPPSTAPQVTSGGSANVVENSPASNIVYQAAATDAQGDRITYSLGGADANKLTIDASGAVRLITTADFETQSVYNFTVIASDSGSGSAPRAVVLTVTDVNESTSTPIINETAAGNGSIGTAQGIDRGILLVGVNPNLPDDELPSATIQGAISGNSDKDFFAITLQAGEKLILDVDGTSGGLDSFLRVYGSNGVQIAENDDQGAFDPGSVGIATTHNTDSLLSFRAATAGTYYFSIESFELSSSGSYKINVSIGPPATQAQIIEEDVQALISGDQWSTTNITYSFPNSATDYPQGFGAGREEGPEPVSFAPFTAIQQAAVQIMLPYIAGLTNLTFQQLFDGNDGAAKLRYAMTDATGAAHAYYPGNYDEAGSLWFNKTSFNSPLKGGYAWMGILHETGHALGLKHGHEAPAISLDRDSVEYSVMTYRSYPNQDLSDGGGYSNEQFGYAQTLMMYDIAALQRMYGADFGTNSGDSVYSWSTTTGEMSINGTGQGAPGNGAGGSQNRVFMTLWDGGGNDTYDFSNYSRSLTIDLRPGEWTLFGAQPTNSQLANLGDGHYARGNVANALLYNDNPQSLIENAIGGSAADTIIANQATNRLTGNGGGDTFKWTSAADGGTGAAADTILDLLRGSDRISLADIDANSTTAGDDAFAFIGTNAFHNVAGELRYQVEGGNVRIQGDVDGNGIADLEIVVNNNTILSGADFFF